MKMLRITVPLNATNNNSILFILIFSLALFACTTEQTEPPELIQGHESSEMAHIKGGCYQMGSPKEEQDRSMNERQHQVCVKDFAIGKYEVTVEEFRKFVDTTGYRTDAERNAGGNQGCKVKKDDEWGWHSSANWRDPGYPQGDDHPVACVSWNDATAYAEWLSKQTGERYHLPTEAEWECATRAGTTGPFSFSGPITTDKVNYNGNFTYAGSPEGIYREKTVPVGSLPANPWGLHEVHGNLWEWTCSKYEMKYAGAEMRCISEDESGAPVLRGGSWDYLPVWVRSALRNRNAPDYRDSLIGFRLAQDL